MRSETSCCPRCNGRGTGAIIPSVHNDVLYWFCVRDFTRWYRWPDGNPLNEKAKRYVEVVK